MIIYLDTETTGLYPGQICQLSYIMQTNKSITAKNLFFSVDSVDYGAYMVHGFSAENLKTLSGGKVFVDRIEEIEKDFNSADLLVSHNTAFDFGFLREEFLRCGKVFTFGDSFCTMKNSVSVCKILRKNGGYKYPKLTELCDYFGITDGEIEQVAGEFFGEYKGYHDARFDTSALFLSANYGMERENNFKILKNYL